MKEEKESFLAVARRQQAIIFLLSLLIILSAIRVEARITKAADRLNGTFFRQLLTDSGELLTSPGRWGKNDWLTFSLSLTASLAWWPVDSSIHDWIADNHPAALTSISRFFSDLGHPLSLIGAISVGYLAGELTDSSSIRQTCLLSAESLLITELIVQAGKISFGRARPYTLEGSSSFHPFTLKGDWQSFPSGHSSAAWALASTLSSRTEKHYLQVLFYSLATGVSLSRLILDKHFASDVVASSLLGYYIGRKISHKASQPAKKTDRLSVSLSVLPGLMSVNFSYQL